VGTAAVPREPKWEPQRECNGTLHASLPVGLGRVPSSSVEDFAPKGLGELACLVVQEMSYLEVDDAC
jgi:hypothetical protein